MKFAVKMPSTAKSWKLKQQYHHHLHQIAAILSVKKACKQLQWHRRKCHLLPPLLHPTSLFSIVSLICLKIILLSTVSDCAKTFYMHWNTSNSIFRIDNTDHIIDVNKGNLAFEFDQVHIICPVYEPGTYENETEKYIIYNVSKVEYETCRITNADPRVIAICDKPQKLMFFTITFRPFTPQPGGLEFLPGNDYYFISTSSKDDLYRRIGGRCSTNNMKVVFKVCCAPEEKNKTITTTNTSRINAAAGGEQSADAGVDISNMDFNSHAPNHHQNVNNVNNIGINAVNTGIGRGNSNKPSGVGIGAGTSINTNLDQFNRIPIQTQNGNNMLSNNLGGAGAAGGVGGADIMQGGNVNIGTGGIMLTPGHSGINLIPTGGNIGGGGGMIHYPGQYPGSTGIRINNVPQHPSYKNNFNNNHNTNDDHHYDKHPNEVVKNEELTYNSAAAASFAQQQHYATTKYSKQFLQFTAAHLELFLAATTIYSRTNTSMSWIVDMTEQTISEFCKLNDKSLFVRICRFNKIAALRLSYTIKILTFNPIVLLLLLIVFLRYYFYRKSAFTIYTTTTKNSDEVEHTNFSRRKKTQQLNLKGCHQKQKQVTKKYVSAKANNHENLS